MKIDFTQQLTNLAGKPLQIVEEMPPCPSCGFKSVIIDKDNKMTLKFAAIESLHSSFSDREEQNITGVDRERRGLLARRIYANPEEIDLTTEEISEIKKVIGKKYNPMIVAQAWKMLENRSEKTLQNKSKKKEG